MHLVTTRDSKIDGWIGSLMASPGWGVGIDRFQHIRYIGSYADPTRYDSSVGWFAPNLSMAANEAVYYNFEAERQLALDATGATVVPLLAGTVSGNLSGEAVLPDAAGFDTLEVDTTMGCGGVGEYGYCPAWDYMAYLYLTVTPLPAENPYAETPCQAKVVEERGTCSVEGADCAADTDCVDGGTCVGYVAAVSAETTTATCFAEGGQLPNGSHTCNGDGTGFDEAVCPTEIEVGRWITTYHREGRWVYDISAMLPFVRSGGTRNFRYETSGPYSLDVSFRYSNQAKAEEPSDTRYLFNGGNHDQPTSFSVPADARKVELATVISQHGSDGENCGEFCDIQHWFVVNENLAGTIVRDFPEAATTYGCMDVVDQGTIPNQYGTWWYGRGGWCPGKEVPTVMADITDQVDIGGENAIEYLRYRNGATYTGGANIRMQSWIVISR